MSPPLPTTPTHCHEVYGLPTPESIDPTRRRLAAASPETHNQHDLQATGNQADDEQIVAYTNAEGKRHIFRSRARQAAAHGVQGSVSPEASTTADSMSPERGTILSAEGHAPVDGERPEPARRPPDFHAATLVRDRSPVHPWLDELTSQIISAANNIGNSERRREANIAAALALPGLSEAFRSALGEQVNGCGPGQIDGLQRDLDELADNI